MNDLTTNFIMLCFCHFESQVLDMSDIIYEKLKAGNYSFSTDPIEEISSASEEMFVIVIKC